MTSPLRITLSVRAVVARAEPFTAYGESFGDVRTTWDVLSTFAEAEEPLVIRVGASGGDERARAFVTSDWLCTADGNRPARLPAPAWRCNEPSLTWSRAQPSWLDAWERCARADWMLHAAVMNGVETPLLVPAACACASTSLVFVAPRDGSPARAVEAALAWHRGEASAAEVGRACEEVARFINSPVAEESALFSSAAYAALSAASLVTHAPAANYHDLFALAESASLAAGYAAAAHARALAQFGLADAASKDMANIVRSHLPTLEVLRAATLAIRGLPPGDIDAAAV